MRRLLVVLLVSVLALAGCGGPSKDSSGPLGDIDVSGAANKAPKVKGVKGVKTKKVDSLSVQSGKGKKLADGDTVNVNYVLYNGKTGKSLTSTYKDGAAVALTLDKKQDKLLAPSIIGKNVGERLVIAAPATDFYGPQGAEQAGVGATDTLVLVAELVSEFKAPEATGTISDVEVSGASGKKPTVTVKKNFFVAETESKATKGGDGTAVKAGDSVKVTYVGIDGRTGKEFDSSYKTGKAADFTLDAQSVIPGFVKGLVGKKVGSRVLITIPYTDGYGVAGNAQAGIKGGDSLIFVIDIAKTGPAPAAPQAPAAP